MLALMAWVLTGLAGGAGLLLEGLRALGLVGRRGPQWMRRSIGRNGRRLLAMGRRKALLVQRFVLLAGSLMWRDWQAGSVWLSLRWGRLG